MKEYRVGFLGFGFIGKVHAYGYRNLAMFYDPVPLHARITHICTSRKEKAEKGKDIVGADAAVTDFRQVTENPDIDIVHICTPNDLHKDALLSAMKHGKHIYCDKPLVATMEEAAAVERALREYEGTAQMTFQNRFFPAIIRAKQLIDEGFLGKLLEFRACYLHSGSATPDAPLKWKLSGARGGGVIADLGAHVFDLLSYLLGDFASLLAETEIAYPERPLAGDPKRKVKVDAEDCAMILARMKRGGLGVIEPTKISTGAEDEVRLEIHGEKGAIRFNGMDAHHLDTYDNTASDSPAGGVRGWQKIDTGQRYATPAAKFPGPKFSIGWIRSHMACLANFLQCVADGRPGDPGLEQGIYVQRLIECARQSAVQRSWMDV